MAAKRAVDGGLAGAREFLKGWEFVPGRVWLVTFDDMWEEYRQYSFRRREFPVNRPRLWDWLAKIAGGEVRGYVTRGRPRRVRRQVVLMRPKSPALAKRLRFEPEAGKKGGWTKRQLQERGRRRFLRVFGITQLEAARRAGVDPSAVTRVLGADASRTSVRWLCSFADKARIDRVKMMSLINGEEPGHGEEEAEGGAGAGEGGDAGEDQA